MSATHYGSIGEDDDSDEEELRTKPRAMETVTTSLRGRGKSKRPRFSFVALLVFAAFIAFGYLVLTCIDNSITFGPDGIFSNEKQRFYGDQLVDHYRFHNRETTPGNNATTWSQRYFDDDTYFKGPGHPIFIILGGEDAMERIIYPFVSQHLARRFSAYTMCVEHRFYGISYPTKSPTNEDLRKLLSVSQALADFARLIRHKQDEFGCGARGSKHYCPVMTVGASYSGFLSALMRLVHPDTVDIGYAGSAPLPLYSHSVDPNTYYDKVTEVADQASPGCASAVKSALTHVQTFLLTTDQHFENLASDLGVCADVIPAYITSNAMFAQELTMVVVAHWAENNMGYYPPTQPTEFVEGCQIFQNPNRNAMDKVSAFLRMRPGFEECFDMRTEVPPGPHGKISAADWSGVGSGPDDYMWEFQSCTLIQECSMSSESMFPPRQYTMERLTPHCQKRFGVTPYPRGLVEEFGFDDLTQASRILFTNGLNDGWAPCSILHNVSDSVIAFNFPNGAHHSDLTHEGPSEMDTPDIKDGHAQIMHLLKEWLDEVREEGASL